MILEHVVGLQDVRGQIATNNRDLYRRRCTVLLQVICRVSAYRITGTVTPVQMGAEKGHVSMRTDRGP